ncbi:MAG: GNAT family N-acetyltransferase, partial [Chloroflexota bacterium]|nr:GNAT family N-acetyltransferase [Chloroflexota bacterium]
MITNDIIRDLGNDLIIRHATLADEQALVDFNIEIHSEGDWDGKGLEDWVRDLISGQGPTVDASDFTIIENTTTGEIISSCCLISQTWSYEDIPFKLGRPELIGTKKEYRRRGLVRQQFEILHQWSKKRGELAQAITGIPYYYRLFGYEMTMNLGGGRLGYEIHVPELKEEQEEPYNFRLAAETDIPFLKTTYERGCRRSMVRTLWDDASWQYELTGKRQ